MPTPEIRIVVNQGGAFVELHQNHAEPVVIGKISNGSLQEYHDCLAELNPDMRHASFEQVVRGVAQRWFSTVTPGCEGQTLSPHLWQYNASSRTYERA